MPDIVLRSFRAFGDNGILPPETLLRFRFRAILERIL
jgi:hypothetical protein